MQKIIGRKKPRDSATERNMASRYEDIWNRIESCQTSQKGEKLKEIEVRLYCDLMNEDMKKSFNKTKIFTKENITLEYFAKYICFKQELKSNISDKIVFSCYDDKNVKIALERNLSIKDVIELTNIKEDIVKLHFSFAK